ncbi:MAG: type II toxin-antitoxin system VapC family toxin [Gemmatimonadaceae bacterium]
MPPKFFLLDTHVWIWALEEDQRNLSPKILQFVRERGKAGEILVSDISFWEVANKSSGGKLTLSIETALWLERAANAPGATYLPIERAALIQSTRLGGAPPRDPADRILIATAQLNAATLVTADAQIIDYARGKNELSVHDARN